MRDSITRHEDDPIFLSVRSTRSLRLAALELLVPWYGYRSGRNACAYARARAHVHSRKCIMRMDDAFILN